MTETTRKARCRLLNHLLNRCPNEELSDLGLCAKHLAAAAGEFAALTAEAREAKAPEASRRAAAPPRGETARLAS